MLDELWPGGPKFAGGTDVFPLGTDSMVLADFARPGNRARMLDLGTGSGILALLLLYGHPERRALGVDLSPAACAAAVENLRQNGLSSQGDILRGDFSQHRELFSGGSFDYAVANPPYFSASGGKAAAGAMALAREDETGPITEVCRAAAWGLKWGGDFALCFRPERLTDLMVALRSAGLEPKRLRLVRHRVGAALKLVLVEARRGGKPGLIWEPELVLQDTDGKASAEYRRIYHIDS